MDPAPTETRTDEAITLTWAPRASEIASAQTIRSRGMAPARLLPLMAIAIAALASGILLLAADLWPTALVLFMLATMLVTMPRSAWLLRSQWTSLFAGDPSLSEQATVHFDATGVRHQGERTTWHRRWSGYAEWEVLGDGTVVLASAENQAARLTVVPHRALAGADDAARLRAVLTRHLGPATPTREPHRRSWLWGARLVVVALAIGSVTLALTSRSVVVDGVGDRLAEAPAELTFGEATYERLDGSVARPERAAGFSFTPGGGLLLVDLDDLADGVAVPAQLWVIDHDGVVRRYVPQG